MTEIPHRLATALADRYQLERHLGEGGMATVYLAEDLKHDRKVAVKVLRPELAAVLGTGRFLREITTTANLRHPHILPLYDSGEADGLLFYVMPYLDGETLRARLDREKQLSLADALQIVREVADALSYAHAQGVIHRDIKPENILFDSGHAVVADFGIARAVRASGGEQLTQTGMAVGTPAYMSPEQATGEVDSRADLYGLACMLYELLAGSPPFTGATAQAIMARHAVDKPPRLRVVRSAVPERVEEAIAKALEKVPADRFESVTDFAAALESGATPRRNLWKRVTQALGVVLGAAVLVVFGLQFLRSTATTTLDENLVAVAPFEIFAADDELDFWREALVDLVSRYLDGAGPLRSVSPTIVTRHVDGRVDRPVALRLGEATGAGLTVFGSVTPGAADSLRVNASLIDVDRDITLGEVEVRDAIERLDRVADSLAVRLLRALGRTRSIGAVRGTSLGSTSVPALNAFLRGEQSYRRGRWDSAQVHYQHAVELDSTFALALRRLYWVAIPLGTQGQTREYEAYARRAAAANHGLPPRESLLVVADSLSAAAGPWAHKVRLIQTLERARDYYPTDPEVWYVLGSRRAYFGGWLGIPRTQALSALERSIQLDSAFAPAYVDGLELALATNRPGDARRYAQSYLDLEPQGVQAEATRLVAAFLAESPDQNAIRHLLEESSPLGLYRSAGMLAGWPDTAEAAVQVLRELLTRTHSVNPLVANPTVRSTALAYALAFRGHVREATEMIRRGEVRPRSKPLEGTLTLLGLPPSEREDLFAQWLAGSGFMRSIVALPWWGAKRDTLALAEFGRRADSMAATRGSVMIQHGADLARAFHAVAAGDSAAALEQLLTFADSLCLGGGACSDERLMTVSLLTAFGRYEEAGQRLLPEVRGWIRDFPHPVDVLWELERGRVFERLRDSDRAIAGYSFVVEAWTAGDPEVQEFVDEARAGLARLAAEPNR